VGYKNGSQVARNTKNGLLARSKFSISENLLTALDSAFSAWRNGAKKREILKKKPQRNRTIVSLGTIHLFDAPETWLHQDNSEEDPTYEDSDVELIPRPIQPVRWRRGRER
jgi:hypothetical protein